VRLRFCGVRGSTPAPGSAFTRVGGHTSCVAVWPDGASVPTLVLDAGTGLRAVTPLLAGGAFEGTILLTHLHWDHTQGLPFFGAGDRADATVHVLVPDAGEPAAEQIARAMSPPHFPVGPEGLLGTWTFHTIGEGRHDVEGIRVLARPVTHKGGLTFGYRLEGEHGSLAYLPDHRAGTTGLRRRWSDEVLELTAGVDVLVHDAQFVTDEATSAAAYGHATVDQALELAVSARVGELVLFHHAPDRTDDELDAMLAVAQRISPVRVSLAVEGRTIDLDPKGRSAPAPSPMETHR
jgi:phosphoribosyl 1,2-cyclic phosphodiesterase